MAVKSFLHDPRLYIVTGSGARAALLFEQPKPWVKTFWP